MKKFLESFKTTFHCPEETFLIIHIYFWLSTDRRPLVFLEAHEPLQITDITETCFNSCNLCAPTEKHTKYLVYKRPHHTQSGYINSGWSEMPTSTESGKQPVTTNNKGIPLKESTALILHLKISFSHYQSIPPGYHSSLLDAIDVYTFILLK